MTNSGVKFNWRNWNDRHFVVLSVVAHILGLGLIQLTANFDAQVEKKNEPVKFEIVEKKALPEIPKKPEPPKPKREKPKIPPSLKKLDQPPVTPVKPVLGVDPEDLTPDAKGIAVPVGNTLMKEDSGERLKAEEVQQYSQDLSADAALITGSFNVPEYTESALDANIEGVFIVDVFVNETGDVQEAELRKQIGYGMDTLVLSAARSAKFKPRKNRLGAAISGWAELKFRLQIP
jgi:TonB family protein